jgi:hypothetical protein
MFSKKKSNAKIEITVNLITLQTLLKPLLSLLCFGYELDVI